VRGAIEVMREEPGRQGRVRALARRVREEIKGMGLEAPGGDSPIVPVVLGEEQRAVEAAGRMREAGLWVVAVRPPTVPLGTSRLRVTLSSGHTDEEVGRLVGVLKGMET
jgi:8-amino-7-oxononanoate synthase